MAVERMNYDEGFARVAAHYAARENNWIEYDLKKVLGKRTRLPKRIIRRLGYEVIYQYSPNTGLQAYRGIRRRGAWLIDHHPEWPFFDSRYEGKSHWSNKNLRRTT